MEIQNNGTYHESQKKSIKKYQTTDKGKIRFRENSNKYYQKMKDDPEFAQKKREASNRYYLKKKTQELEKLFENIIKNNIE
jgi:DNA-binding PadR family transcriptional regulator